MNFKVAQQSIYRLVRNVRAGMFFNDVMQSREGVCRQDGDEFTDAGAMQNFLRGLAMRQTVLRHVERDV